MATSVRYFSSSATTTAAGKSIHQFVRHQFARTHLIFGANTDVGKTLTSAGLVRASLRDLPSANSSSKTHTVHYIKPLQCGGSDEGFIEKHCPSSSIAKLDSQTLFSWDTPASPHIASRQENNPKSDQEVLGALQSALSDIAQQSNNSADHPSTTWIETAGGVLSPSSASPDNCSPHHASAAEDKWGWLTQGDLYKPLSAIASVVLCGDGRLGGTRE